MRQALREIVEILLDKKDYTSSKQIAETLGYSERYIINIINDSELKRKGFFFEGNPKIGYRIQISDMMEFRKNYEKSTDLEELIAKVLRVLIEKNDFIRIDDLAEYFFLSRSSMERVIKSVKLLAEEYDLKIVSRQKYGICIQGSELNKRACNAHLLHAKDEYQDKTLKIQEMLYDILGKFDYIVSDLNFNNLVYHVLILLKRIRQKNYTLVSIDLKQEYPLQERIAQEIIQCLEEQFEIEIPEQEKSYLVLHLLGKQTINDNREVSEEIYSLVSQIIERVYQDMGYDLRDDFDLHIRLCLHIQPMMYRLQYHMKQQNPILNKVKRELKEGFEVALIAKKVILENYGFEISEDEISFIAMHFSLSLSQDAAEDEKCNLKFIIVCSTGRGAARLSAYRLLSQFKVSEEDITLSSMVELRNMDLSLYDCILSSVSVPFKVGIPVLYINPWMDQEASIKIGKFIEEHDRKKCAVEVLYERNFYSNLPLTSKEDVLRFITEECKKYYPQENIRYKDLWEREMMSSTEVGNQCSMPHPLTYFSKEPIIQVIILKKPIKWQREKVKYIFFIVFPKHYEEREGITDKITELICSKEKILKLGKNPTFENMLNILRTL